MNPNDKTQGRQRGTDKEQGSPQRERGQQQGGQRQGGPQQGGEAGGRQRVGQTNDRDRRGNPPDGDDLDSNRETIGEMHAPNVEGVGNEGRDDTQHAGRTDNKAGG